MTEKQWTSEEQKSLNYRADKRTLEEFQKDIEEGSRIEQEIIVRYCALKNYEWRELGHDDGTEVKGRSTALADYEVNGEPLEVKFCRPLVRQFHLKKNHVESYVQQGAKILFVMGYDTDKPMFTIIDPNTIIDGVYPVRFFWKKHSYRIPTKDFEWEELP